MNLRNVCVGLLLLIVPMGHAATRKGYIPVSAGARIYYEERGEGTPLILLHGHSLDTRMWNKQFKAFSRRWRVVRFDFRGYGRSSEQREDVQFTHLADLLTVMDSLHIGKAYVVGLSMGAFVASDMLAMAPERMLGCVLASGGLKTYKGPSQPMDSVEKAKRDIEIAALKAKGVDRMKQEWLDALVGSGGTRRETMRRPLKKMIAKWPAWQPLHYEPRVMVAGDAVERFKSQCTRVPVLFLVGGAELKGRQPSRPWMMQYLPESRLQVVHDAGHMMNMEQPEAFNEAVTEFIGSLPAEK